MSCTSHHYDAMSHSALRFSRHYHSVLSLSRIQRPSTAGQKCTQSGYVEPENRAMDRILVVAPCGSGLLTWGSYLAPCRRQLRSSGSSGTAARSCYTPPPSSSSCSYRTAQHRTAQRDFVEASTISYKWDQVMK